MAESSDTADSVFTTIDQAIDDLAAGRIIVLVDDEHRENEGDLVCAAEKIRRFWERAVSWFREEQGQAHVVEMAEGDEVTPAKGAKKQKK